MASDAVRPAGPGQGHDLTAAEAARRLGVSSLHVADLLEAGELDFYMVGTDVCFTAAEIERYEERRHVGV
ncbi:excisionase family DNA-binding protein [Myceligenerans crystallogenes]